MKKIAVAVTGASGSIYTRNLLQQLEKYKDQLAAVDIVWSDNAKTVWYEELQDHSYESVTFKVWDKNDFYAPFASGSAGYDALIICPCSMGTLGRIAAGISDNLITRAADVMLKERSSLICVIRETPYSLVHINNMKTVTEAGGIICPASPSFYSRPEDMDAMARTVTDRVLKLAGIHTGGYRWGEQD